MLLQVSHASFCTRLYRTWNKRWYRMKYLSRRITIDVLEIMDVRKGLIIAKYISSLLLCTENHRVIGTWRGLIIAEYILLKCLDLDVLVPSTKKKQGQKNNYDNNMWYVSLSNIHERRVIIGSHAAYVKINRCKSFTEIIHKLLSMWHAHPSEQHTMQ